MKPTDFATTLSRYLSEYLPGQRNVSPHTMKSYRETFRLLLRYGKGCGHSIERLCLRHMDEPFIVGFLSWLEHERNSSIATRNQRLACIHGFFRYVQIENPDAMASYQRILSIPMKKAPVPTVHHLTPDALKLILDQPDLTRPCGRRDVTLLSVLYDTGARVQELADLRVRDVRLDQPPIVTLTGKGRKTRQVPLMSATESLLRHYMTEARLLQNGMQDHPLFFNRRHGNLTQKGISFVLDKYVSRARAKSSMVPDKVTPHSLRHTKAMDLLHARVNPIYIRDFLGHADLSTTEIYARTDTELKREALEKAYPDMIPSLLPHWTQDEDLLAWLMNL
ncbi:MAG TPA: tyrosine-type recombinase/integrase [Nitrospirota bacterium]|nr:tyrosine-type recombinase/integrase [Nitrospirota bacterium]